MLASARTVLWSVVEGCRLLLLAVLLPLLGSASGARAQAASARDEAIRHFDRGVAFVEEGAYEQAVLEFERAHMISAADAVLYNLGMAYAAVGRPAEAVTTLTRFLATQAQTLSDADRTRLVAEVQRQRALLGNVRLHIEPSGARVRVDGRDLGTGPFSKERLFTLGDHWIEVQHPGYIPVLRTFSVEQGSRMLGIRLIPEPARVAAAKPAARALAAADSQQRGPSRWSDQAEVGYGVGGLGLAAGVAALAVYLASNHSFHQWQKENRQLREMQEMQSGDVADLQRRQTANDDRLRSVWRLDKTSASLAAIGGVGLVVGTVLLWRSKRASARAARRGISLAMQATAIHLRADF